MSEALTVLLKTVSMFLIMLLGWAARRGGLLPGVVAGALSRFVVDVAYPALVFTQMAQTANLAVLRGSWYYPLLGAAIILVGEVVGLITAGAFAPKEKRSTFVFLVAVCNWIYLPLPIVGALYGEEGFRAVLLFNVGTQVMLWTVALWTLRGGRPDLAGLKAIILNPGLLATAAGIMLALVAPVVAKKPDGGFFCPVALGGAVMEATALVGSLTVPLSLVVTGVQLGGLAATEERWSRALLGVLAARLAMAPLAMVVLVRAVGWAGVHIPEVPRLAAYIISAMPVAISCSIFTERFGGDTSLAARGIFYSTLLSIVTMPTFVFLVRLGDL